MIGCIVNGPRRGAPRPTSASLGRERQRPGLRPGEDGEERCPSRASSRPLSVHAVQARRTTPQRRAGAHRSKHHRRSTTMIATGGACAPTTCCSASPTYRFQQESNGPSTRPRACSTGTDRRCTCASRSSTTSTCWPSCVGRAPCSWADWRRNPDGAIAVFSAHGMSPAVPRRCGGARAAHGRRDLTASRTGPRQGATIPLARVRRAADRSRRSRGDRGHGRGGTGPAR